MQNYHIAMPLYRKKSFEAFQRRLEAVRPKKSGDATLSGAMQDFMAAASAETLASLEKGLRTRTLELAGVCYVLMLNNESPTLNVVYLTKLYGGVYNHRDATCKGHPSDMSRNLRCFLPLPLVIIQN